MVMGKKVLILKNHAEAEQFVLEKGFRLSPEDRIRWLYRQLEIVNKMNLFSLKPNDHLSKKSVVSICHQMIKALNDCNVRYLLVGGFAVNFHGYNRTTSSLDLWVDISESNLESIEKAMELLG